MSFDPAQPRDESGKWTSTGAPNHRGFARHGQMHPSFAKHMQTGREVDFYLSGSGNKSSGMVRVVTKSQVHIKEHKDGLIGMGKLHKFFISER